MDGAMGTQLQLQGLPQNCCAEQWNLTQTDTVEAIHQAYIQAGASFLLTNTFQANSAALAKHGLENNVRDIWRAAMASARRAADGRAWILADVGPCPGDSNLPFSEMVGGTEGILFETFSDPASLELLVGKTRAAGPLAPLILASFSYQRSATDQLQTASGFSPEEVAERVTSVGLGALGVNCGREISLKDIAEIVSRYRQVSALPIFARPNAGTPSRVDGRWHYPRSTAEMASGLRAILEAGATMIGGCCGTSPAHIAAFAPVIEAWNAGRVTKRQR
jgi:methionine synthase I (cobalamin-dependent)